MELGYATLLARFFMSTKNDELKALVESGLQADVCKMERAYVLIKQITNYGTSIDAYNNGEFSRLFVVIQRSLLTEVIMSVSRLYDKPNKKYPTNCLLSILEFIKENSSNLVIVEKPNLKKYLLEIGIARFFIDLIDTDEESYNKMIAEQLKVMCFAGDKQDIILRLRNLRDKKIAHNERINFINTPVLIELKKLTNDVKKVLGIIGWSYTSQIYHINGKFLLSDDIQELSIDLEKLLKKAGI